MNILTGSLNSAVLGREPSGPPIGPEARKQSILQQYWRVFRRWRWLILGVTAAAIALGLVATMLMTPQYTARTTIEISREADQVTDFQGVERDVSVADQEFYQTQYGLLQSRTLAERVAVSLRLVDNPDFFAMYDDADADTPAFDLINGRYSPQGRAERQRVAGKILLDNVGIEPTRLSRLVDISFNSPDPGFSARVANSWAENFIQSNLDRKLQSTSYGREVLQRQLAEYKQRLDESQRQLVAYASREQIINLPAQTSGSGGVTQERSIVADQLAALNAELSEATADRIEAEARYRQAGRSGTAVAALTNNAINNLRQRRAELAAEYQQLMVRFEPGYPAARAVQEQIDDLDRSISREESRVSGSLEAQFRQAQQRQGALQAQVNRLKKDFLDLRRRSIQYNIFQQEVDTNRALYDGLLQRFKEIGVAGGVGINNVAIVDLADVPLKPSSPRLGFNILISLLLGLGLGGALALVREQFDETIGDPADVEPLLGLPLLGSVPVVNEDSPLEALLDRKSELVDAYLAVQTSLAFVTEHGVPRSFAVTSTRPAEGKSTTALALATTLARGGRKVILVDGDMRSPSIHTLGNVNHDHGLSNFLAGEDNIESLTFHMENLNLTAMSAGPLPPNAAELLASNRLSELIVRLLESYDHVVVDSPPVLGLADAPLIAGRVEGVVYAVESRGIRSSMVRTALARLASANVRVFGGVLTKFDASKGHAAYGYDYGYGYGRTQDRTAVS